LNVPNRNEEPEFNVFRQEALLRAKKKNGKLCKTGNAQRYHHVGSHPQWREKPDCLFALLRNLQAKAKPLHHCFDGMHLAVLVTSIRKKEAHEQSGENIGNAGEHNRERLSLHKSCSVPSLRSARGDFCRYNSRFSVEVKEKGLLD